ncbi:MAG TPA: nuclear transport factor 2 family protein [Vicinamibacterales bacterium]|nr:nuclear transport factor 2 family protein [Vicinamibacterales bacterium]
MRTMLSTAAAVVLVATFASAQTGTGQAGTGQTPTGQVGTTGVAADEDAIRQLGEQYAAAWNSGNASRAAALFTEDGSFTEVTGQTMEGRSAIERELSQDEIGTAKTGMKLSIATDSIRFLQPDLAVVTGKTQFVAGSGAGRGPAGHYMSLVRKVGSEWKVAAVHAAVNPPPGVGPATGAGQPTGTTGAAGGASAEADVEAVLELGKEWQEAARNKDVETLRRIYHDDFTEVDPGGMKRGKEEAIAEVRAGDLVFESFSQEAVDARVYGDTAVVVGTTRVAGRYKDEDISGRYRWTDTYVRRDGRWQAIASQVTRVMERPE